MKYQNVMGSWQQELYRGKGLSKEGDGDHSDLPGRAQAVPWGPGGRHPLTSYPLMDYKYTLRGVKYSQMLTELVYSPDILCGKKSVGESPVRGIRVPHTTA